MKKCPFCAETIQDQAIKCKHCGSLINSNATADSCPSGAPRHSGFHFSPLVIVLMTIGIVVIIACLMSALLTLTDCGNNGSSAQRSDNDQLQRELEQLYEEVPKSQVEAIVSGTGSAEDRQSGWLNASQNGNLKKILDLQRRGAFGKEAADAINNK